MSTAFELEAVIDIGTAAHVSHSAREVSTNALLKSREPDILTQKVASHRLGTELVFDSPDPPVGEPYRHQGHFISFRQSLGQRRCVAETAQKEAVGLLHTEDSQGSIRGRHHHLPIGDVRAYWRVRRKCCDRSSGSSCPISLPSESCRDGRPGSPWPHAPSAPGRPLSHPGPARSRSGWST